MFEIKYDTVKKSSEMYSILKRLSAALSQLGYYFQFREKIKCPKETTYLKLFSKL